MNKASILSFKDLLYIEMGQSPKSMFVNADGDGIPLLNGPAEFTSKHPIPKQFTTKGNRFSEELDILFCVRGSTTGRMNIADQKYAIGRGLAAIRHMEGSHLNAFVRGLIEQNLSGLLGGSMGSVFPNLTKNQLLDYKCVIPNLSIQKQIAKVLSDLDAKIEVNNKINQELEAMAKTLYDYWFVQFDFPDAHGKPYKSSGGKMVYNEALKREIPKGWEVKELQNISKCIMGQSPKGSTYNKERVGTPLLNGPADYENGVLKGRTFTTEPTRLCQKDDMVLCIRATIGNLVYSEQEFCLGRGVAAVRPIEERLSELVYYLLLQEIERFKIQATGSIIKGITKDDLTESKCLIPSDDYINLFHNQIKPMFDNIRTNKKQNQKLSALRDWLLPMLMNGQVTVGEVKQELGMVAEENTKYGSL